MTNDLPEDLVYNMAKIMYEKNDLIAKGHARGDQISLENALKGIDPVPLHPGAKRFFQEKGLVD